MTRFVWRIATDTPSYTADELGGKGAEASGGRWNEKGVPVVYGSETRALTCLETLVHFKSASLPLNRFLVRIDIPDAVWKAARRETAGRLPIGWEAEPPGMVSIGFGMQWLASGGSCLLIVPSVIVAEENNILLNPRHPDAGRVKAAKVRRWLYDPRLGR